MLHKVCLIRHTEGDAHLFRWELMHAQHTNVSVDFICAIKKRILRSAGVQQVTERLSLSKFNKFFISW